MTSIIHALAKPFSLNYTSFNTQRAEQTLSSPRSQANMQDAVSISDAGRQALIVDNATQAIARFQQLMAEKTAGQNFLRNAALANPQSSDVEQFAYALAHEPLSDGQGGGGLISLGGHAERSAALHQWGIGHQGKQSLLYSTSQPISASGRSTVRFGQGGRR